MERRRLLCSAEAVSADGRVVVGTATDSRGNYRAFRWTAETGMQDLGTLGGLASAASVSGHSALVCTVDAEGKRRIFHWAVGIGWHDLGSLGAAWLDDVSALVRWLRRCPCEYRTLRWLPEGGAGALANRQIQTVTALSPDGRCMAGQGLNAQTGRTEAYIYIIEQDPDLAALGKALCPTNTVLTWVDGNYHSVVGKAISSDGPVVVGSVDHGHVMIFDWTKDQGVQLWARCGTPGEAHAITPDGSVIVGLLSISEKRNNAKASRIIAFRRVGQHKPEKLGTLGGWRSEAVAVSPDGRVVVGWSDDPSGNPRAFRWTPETGMQDLGTLGGASSWARAVSADGRVGVGVADTADGFEQAFRWTAETGMLNLGTRGVAQSVALAASADGSTVFGCATDAYSRLHVFRWTGEEGMHSIGIVSDGVQFSAMAPDGRIAIGHFTSPNVRSKPGRRACLWTPTNRRRRHERAGGSVPPWRN